MIMTNWIKIIVNSLIGGLITGISVVVTNGQINPNVSLWGALLSGLLAFLIELKTSLQKEDISVKKNNPGNVKKNLELMWI